MVVVFPYGTCAFCEAGLPKPHRPSKPRVICDRPECVSACKRAVSAMARAKAKRRRVERTEWTCSRCKVTFPLTLEFFSPDRRDRETGEVVRWSRWCKVCKRQGFRETWERRGDFWREKRAEQRREKVQDPVQAQRIRESARRARAKYEHRNPEKRRETSRRYRERVKADPVRAARRRESERMRYRLRKMRDGEVPRERVPREALRDERLLGVTMPHVPAAPVAALIERLADELPRNADGSRPLRVVCRQLGISDRDYRAYRNGERETMRFATADRVLTRAGLLWWEVWPQDVYPAVHLALGG